MELRRRRSQGWKMSERYESQGWGSKVLGPSISRVVWGLIKLGEGDVDTFGGGGGGDWLWTVIKLLVSILLLVCFGCCLVLMASCNWLWILFP